VSPLITPLSEPKFTTPYRVPAVAEEVALLLTTNAPATVLVAFIEKVALLELLSQVLVVVPEIEPNVRVCLTVSEYFVVCTSSVQPEWELMVSAMAGVAPVLVKPTYQAVIWVPLLKVPSSM